MYIPEKKPNEFKVGDKVKIIGNSYRSCFPIGSIGVIEKVGPGSCYLVGQNGDTQAYFYRELELITNSNTTPMRKRYMLVKDSYDLKKGAIVEEKCDDGTQDFVLITPEHDKFPDGRRMTIVRDVITNNPKWFQEVKPLYVPANKEKAVQKFLEKLK